MLISKQQALDYHDGGRPGKIEITPTTPCRTQRDLSLAYTPGVAVPCLEIQKNPQDAYKYTGRGNLVAVLSNGTAVLGLGDIGALAGKPLMEGKAMPEGTDSQALFRAALAEEVAFVPATASTPT
jgi:malate dehydrogenase (oxaloacetate-decarboxylating)(NADP+)